jgi:hypothetical protein
VSFEGPDGKTWSVRRRWLPWRRRIRDVPDVPDAGFSGGDDPISAIIGLFLLVLAIPAIVVLTLLIAELLLLVALLPVVVLLRLAAGWAGFPWPVEVRSRPRERRVLGWQLEHTEGVRGWRGSGRRIGELRGEIESRRFRPTVRHRPGGGYAIVERRTADR